MTSITSAEFRAGKLLIIGIDPGVTTGISFWDTRMKALTSVRSASFLEALDLIDLLLVTYDREQLLVRFEDARLRKWFGKSGREQLQGAGSIKRDCSLWEDYLTKEGIPFEKVAPKDNKTKLNAVAFKSITGWAKATNEHSRDSAMLCYGY